MSTASKLVKGVGRSGMKPVNQAAGALNMMLAGDCGSGGALRGRGIRALAHVELDSARQLDDGFGVVAVLEQRIFDGLRAVDEQAAIEAVLLLGHPLAPAILADE